MSEGLVTSNSKLFHHLKLTAVDSISLISIIALADKTIISFYTLSICIAVVTHTTVLDSCMYIKSIYRRL